MRFNLKRITVTMKHRRMIIWKYFASRRRGSLVKILFIMVVLAMVGGWMLAEVTSNALLPPAFHQDLEHFRRNRSLKHYLDAIQVLIEPSSTPCGKQKNISVLALVTSSPLRFDHRQAIRNTWAKYLPTYFFMGLNGAAIDDLLVDNYMEAKMYSDLIVYDFPDHYQNLTLKTALMMKWALDRCRTAEFVFKTDDDVLVNPWGMQKVLQQNKDAALIGYRKENTYLHRDQSNKWYLPRWLHHEDHVPQYLSGTGYLVSGKYIDRILEAADHVPLVNLEDIYLTYLVANETLGLTLTHDPRLSPYKPWLRLPCMCWRLASVHSVSADEMLAIWPGLKALGEQYEKNGDESLCSFYAMYLSSAVFLF